MQLNDLLDRSHKAFAVETALVKTLVRSHPIDLLIHSQGKFDAVQYLSAVTLVDWDLPLDRRAVWVTCRDEDGSMIDRYLHGAITLRELWVSCDTNSDLFLQRGACWHPGQQVGVNFALSDLDAEFVPGPESYLSQGTIIKASCQECDHSETWHVPPL